MRRASSSGLLQKPRIEPDSQLAEFQHEANEIVVHFMSKRKRLGFGADRGDDGKSLVVARIDAEGLLVDWNAARPQQAIVVGDRIVEVNGKSGSSQMLAERLQSQQRHIVVFLPGARPASSRSGSSKSSDRSTGTLPLVNPQSRLRQIAASLQESPKSHTRNANGDVSPVTLNVSTASGPLCSVPAQRSWDLDKIMSAVAFASRVPSCEQFLIVDAMPLRDDEPLRDFTCQNAVDVTLVRRKCTLPIGELSTCSSDSNDDACSCISSWS